MSEKSLREIMRQASEEARVDIAKAVEAATAPLKLPAEIEAAMSAWATAEHAWRDARDCSMEATRRQQADDAREALRSAVLKYGDERISETRAERDAARAEVERLSQRDDEWRNFETQQRAACDRYLERTRAAETQLAAATTERDAAVAFVAKFLECHGKFWSSERSYAELVAAARAIKKQES